MPTAKIEDKRFEILFDKFQKNKGTIDGYNFDLDLVKITETEFHLIYNHRSYNIELLESDEITKEYRLKINGQISTVQIEDEFDQLLKKMGMDKASVTLNTDLKAPMPGMVLTVLVTEGQEITKGDGLIILEAMKMENNIKAIADGVVKKIICQQGQAVEKNQLLIEFE